MHCHVHYIQHYTYIWMMLQIYQVLSCKDNHFCFLNSFILSVIYLTTIYGAPALLQLSVCYSLILIHHNLLSPNSTMGTATQGVSLSHVYSKPLVPKIAQERAK